MNVTDKNGSETVGKPTFVYIVGKGHSGSTILELLLNRSANVAAMGEIDMLALQIYRDHRTRWVGKCSCGARPQDCEYWGRVIKEVKERFGADLVADPMSWRISDVGLEEEYGIKRPASLAWYRFHQLIRSAAYRSAVGKAGPFSGRYRTWIENRDFVATTFARLCNVEAVVDASKDPLQMRDIVTYSKLPVKVLFLTRDVRGLVWSALKRKRNTVEREARSWVQLNSRTLNLLAGIDRNAWMHVTYEGLCADTGSVMEAIHKFIGVERQEMSPNHERSRRHTIAGNRTRLRDLDVIREDQDWRQHLSPEQLETIASIAGGLSEELGYGR
jgi:hypothetical protein